uniref:(northern house mosquito) hypothetical protein n=1 Tax=Culex pipiens TaxID=7175 RepID=A0A8D8G6V4_CULPI
MCGLQQSVRDVCGHQGARVSGEGAGKAAYADVSAQFDVASATTISRWSVSPGSSAGHQPNDVPTGAAGYATVAAAASGSSSSEGLDFAGKDHRDILSGRECEQVEIFLRRCTIMKVFVNQGFKCRIVSRY